MTSIIKAVYRRLFPVALRERISYLREWGAVVVNYALMRSTIMNLFHSFGAWPHALYIEGTNICNAACVFCAYPQMERPKVTMPMKTFQKAIDEYLALGPAEVDLTPIVGDPFADKHLFERLDDLSARPGVKKFHFYTNAILMKPSQIERLMPYGERFRIFCSFGGFTPEVYHRIMGVDKFHEAVAGIRALIEAKIRTGSKIQIQVNLRVPKGDEGGEFWDYLQLRKKEGAITLDGVADYDNWGGKILNETLNAAGLIPKPPPVHQGACRRLLTGPVILSDGRVNACCCRDVEATLIIGDINKEPLKEILSGPGLKDLLRRHAQGDFPEICKTCTKYQSVWAGVRDE